MSKEQRKEIESYIQLLVYAESYEQNRKDIETIRELRRNALKYLFDGYKSIKGSKLSLSLFPLIKGKPIAKLKFLKPKIKPEMGCNERIEKKYIKDCDEGKGKKKKEKSKEESYVIFSYHSYIESLRRKRKENGVNKYFWFCCSAETKEHEGQCWKKKDLNL
jgi:hypothetical protein